ncbi:hypothetical protein UFOVP276_240 [uncultured Caudovirales phage]|uniref:Uncharacterized protein n=1 Tax=uncultured Caudovirales phage TaxID=2100421 RepID=A0A6J5LAZ9_9CAUD|nr:hypothetical protein UFOVP127_134 [uncultured Caudovirales phage]CAB4135284.1 hypothetical protein UFOVP276_240 [uncultured Caudovirales phage]
MKVQLHLEADSDAYNHPDDLAIMLREVDIPVLFPDGCLVGIKAEGVNRIAEVMATTVDLIGASQLLDVHTYLRLNVPLSTDEIIMLTKAGWVRSGIAALKKEPKLENT